MRKLFRVVIAIPCWLFLQSIGTMAFTMFLIIPFIGFFAGLGNLIAFLGTGNRYYLHESIGCFAMLITLFGGTLVCYSWIKTGDFDLDNLGMTHLENKYNTNNNE